MANPETREVEVDDPPDSGLPKIASSRHGITSTLAGPVLKISLLPKAPPRQPKRSSVWRSLWETDPPVFPVRLGPGPSWPKVRSFTPAFLTSTLFQTAFVFFLYSMPFAFILSWFMGPPPVRISTHTRLEVIKLDALKLSDYLPVIKPPGQGKAPGRGEKHSAHPRLGASHFDPRITIISNPPKPDNSLLTLKNLTAPPDMTPLKDLKIPDFISGGPAPAPAVAKSPVPAPEMVAKAAPPVEKPSPAPPPTPLDIKDFAPPVTPKISYAPAPPPVEVAFKLPDIPAPHLEIPPPPPPPKNVSPPAPEAASAPSQPAPKETAHPAANASSAPQPGGQSGAAAAGQPQPGGGPQIMSLGVDPIPLKDLSSIPGGVHNGAFSISPTGTLRGSPGGVPGGSPEVGEGGQGPGGDKSVAVGEGKGAPGGGGPGSPAVGASASPAVSVSGPAGAAGISAGTLPPLKPEDLVYPVKPETPKARAPTMVVSTGSTGGGGLGIYHVLHGGKIYTVYLSMPGKSWVLQYCAHESPPQADSASREVRFQIQPPLTPPAAIDQFDFHRPPQPQDPANSMIILHGAIREDGVVSDMKVLQGRDPIDNAAAIAAFLRWKFKPALRAGIPVPLEILVGIP